MSKSFKTTVNSLHHFDIEQTDLEDLDISKKSKDQYHLIHENLNYKAQILESNFNQKQYTVEVNGNTYEVKISDSLDLLISELGMEASFNKKENTIKAPMPGLIVSINVILGQEVKEGDGVLVLEAMKMENTLIAPQDGVVKSISIKPGDKVEKNEILIEIEA